MKLFQTSTKHHVSESWSLKLSDQYTDKDVWDCDADLQVPVMTGALIEGAATFLCRIVSRMISEIEPRFGGAIDALVGTSLVLAGEHRFFFLSFF